MKKILCFFALLLINSPATGAVDIPYVNALPYKPYEKQISLNKLSTFVYDNKYIFITKNLYEFESIYSKTLRPYEYVVKNNSNNSTYLKGIITQKDFCNRDFNRKHGMRVVPALQASYSNGPSFIPVYGIKFGYDADKEKYPFIRDFPKNKEIKPGETIRILALGTKMDEVQKLKFIFVQDENEFEIEF